MWHLTTMRLPSTNENWFLLYEVERVDPERHAFKLVKRVNDPTEFMKVGEAKFFSPSTIYKKKTSLIKAIMRGTG